MGVYTRFKRGPEGFRALVELLETTPMSRRQRMIDVGMEEDPAFTEKALQFVLTFEDILKLPDLELAELLVKVPPRTVAYAIKAAPEDTKTRFMRNCTAPIAAQIRDYMNVNIGPREMGGAQLKMIEIARQLERQGLVRTKRLPSAL